MHLRCYPEHVNLIVDDLKFVHFPQFKKYYLGYNQAGGDLSTVAACHHRHRPGFQLIRRCVDSFISIKFSNLILYFQKNDENFIYFVI